MCSSKLLSTNSVFVNDASNDGRRSSVSNASKCHLGNYEHHLKWTTAYTSTAQDSRRLFWRELTSLCVLKWAGADPINYIIWA